MSAARRVLDRADELARFSEEPGRITRPLATPAHAEALGQLRTWMVDAGLQTRVDALGNLAGRRGGPGPLLMIGSHFDSVADAGRYDGILGVLIGLAVAETTDVPLELVAFADEEGLRFESTFLGSRGFLGQIAPEELEFEDRKGVRLQDALGAPLGRPLYEGARAYFEVHIEQGPVLMAKNLPLGVVSAIAGQTRLKIIFKGHAAHAGTTPMHLRRDALGAAAEFVLAVERTARDTPGLVATVGELEIPRSACNVVPGTVEATLDIRHADDGVRGEAIAALRAEADRLCARRSIGVGWAKIHEHPATPCTPALVARLAAVVSELGLPVHEVTSGAGHDAVTMAAVTEIAMLFVRSTGGSHNPDECVEEADVALAIEAASRFAEVAR